LETYKQTEVENPQKVFCYMANAPTSRTIMTKKGIIQHGQPLLDDWSSCPHIDIVVVGSVAVTKSGHRLGKGLGYAELEWGILYELGVVDQSTLVITTVHDYQIVSVEELSQDLQEADLGSTVYLSTKYVREYKVLVLLPVLEYFFSKVLLLVLKYIFSKYFKMYSSTFQSICFIFHSL